MRRFNKWLQIILAGLLGTSFVYGEGCAGTVARNVNPCGTILDCDPFEYSQLFTDHTRPDYNLDPTCTVPGYCGGTPWPPGTGPIITPPGQDSGVGGETTGTATATGTTTGG